MSARRIIAASVVLTVILASVGSTSASNKNFSERSLRGAWPFSASGTVGGAQAAAVGIITFDGAGACTTVARLNVGGAVSSLTSTTCSYTVNADGTGAITSTFPGLPQTFLTDLVIVERKEEFLFIISDSAGATVASGVSKRQD